MAVKRFLCSLPPFTVSPFEILDNLTKVYYNRVTGERFSLTERTCWVGTESVTALQGAGFLLHQGTGTADGAVAHTRCRYPSIPQISVRTSFHAARCHKLLYALRFIFVVIHMQTPHSKSKFQKSFSKL